MHNDTRERMNRSIVRAASRAGEGHVPSGPVRTHLGHHFKTEYTLALTWTIRDLPSDLQARLNAGVRNAGITTGLAATIFEVVCHERSFLDFGSEDLNERSTFAAAAIAKTFVPPRGLTAPNHLR